jgi:hypothetical protein
VEGIVEAALVAVLEAVRAREDEESRGPQHAGELGDEGFLFADVLDRLERHGDIDARIGEGKPRAGRAFEARVGDARVGGTRVRDRLAGDVDTGHSRGLSCKERRPIALATGHVEHLASGDPAAREVVAMPVLDPDLAARSGNESLAGKGKLAHGPSPFT